MKINLVGDSILDRVEMALNMVRERHGADPEMVGVVLRINGEEVVVDGETVLFREQKMLENGEQRPNPRERHYLWNGYLSKHSCALWRK